MVINTKTTQASPQNKTPFKVWFSRKPRWITARPMEEVDEDGNDLYDNEINAQSSNDKDYVLTEIETRVAAYNARLYAQMIKANSRRSAVFSKGSIATLQIPLKLRVATEPSRLPVRILVHKNSQYKLQCQHGRLTGRFQSGELNSINAATGNSIGSGIRMAPERKGNKDVTISLPSAVAKENNRGCITSAQKAGRTTKSGAKSGAKLSPKPRQKSGRKPGRNSSPKPSAKGKQAEVVTIENNLSDPEPVPAPKSRRKRKQVEVEDSSKDPSPRRLRRQV